MLPQLPMEIPKTLYLRSQTLVALLCLGIRTTKMMVPLVVRKYFKPQLLAINKITASYSTNSLICT